MLPIVPGILASALFLLISVFVSRQYALPWWVAVLLAMALIGAILVATRFTIARRYVTIRLLREVSSSRCGDRFLSLASLVAKHSREPSDALNYLASIVAIRKYPGSRFLDDMRRVADVDQRVKDHASRSLAQYTVTAAGAKRLVRAASVENLAAYLRSLSSETYLVLYGYSSLTCEGLAAAASSLTCTVFLIEDLQYGIEGSLGEHLQVQEHLTAAHITPYVLPFDQIAPLCSGAANFVRDSSGHAVPLSHHRHVTALLGCEAVSVAGDVLIPSQVRGRPSETAKFVEVFQQATTGEVPPVKIVIASESYKTYRAFEADAAASHAPLGHHHLRDLLFVAGLLRRREGTEVELVKLPAHRLAEVIDDTGIHRLVDSRLDLSVSYDLWKQRTVGTFAEHHQSVDPQSILADAKVAIFDLDGVLVDDEPLHFFAFTELAREQQQTLSHEEYVNSCSGRTDAEGIAGLLRQGTLNGDPESLSLRLRAIADQHRSTTAPPAYRGVLAFLSKLTASRVECFVVTASSARDCDQLLDAAGLAPFFPEAHRFYEVTAAGRHRAYANIAASCKSSSSACVVLDDSPANLGEASRLGMKTIGVATTRPISELTADVVVRTPMDLLPSDESET